MKLTDYELRKLSEDLVRELKYEIKEMVKQQLKEIAFQLDLFADKIDDKYN